MRKPTYFDRAMLVTAAALILADLILARVVHLDGVFHYFVAFWPIVLPLVGFLWLCRQNPLPKLAEFAEPLTWGFILMSAMAPLALVAGRSYRPLQDSALAVWDMRLHFNTSWIAGLTGSNATLHFASSFFYESLPVLTLLGAMVPPGFGRADASRKFVVSVVIGSLITIAISAMFPAVGPWTTEHFSPSTAQANVATYLALLHSDTSATIKNAGIVSFPSYHVVLAILSAISLCSVYPLRVPALLWAALISLSTVTTGWHYGVDVLGGVGVSFFAICGSRCLNILTAGQSLNTNRQPVVNETGPARASISGNLRPNVCK